MNNFVLDLGPDSEAWIQRQVQRILIRSLVPVIINRSVKSLKCAGLTSLQKLKLSENRLERIESGAFAPLPVAGTLRVELADNPLVCDCALAWILDWAEVALARARCAQPASLLGLLVRTAAALF
jgi:hypothetical protein